MGLKIAEFQYKLSNFESVKKVDDPESQALVEIRAALEAERAGTAKLERTLAAALADNSTLAAQLHNQDNNAIEEKPDSPERSPANIYPIDSFLAE